MRVNPSLQAMDAPYLFAEIAERVGAFLWRNPDAKLLRLGIGDVTEPLAPCVVAALAQAAQEMGERTIGYGPTQGHPWLRERIATTYTPAMDPSSIFVTDGAKTVTAVLPTLLGKDATVTIHEPAYPVYEESHRIAGRNPQHSPADCIYLCSPNNPTGDVLSMQALTAWVQLAHRADALIVFDAAYQAFVRDKNVPKSILEIPGADKVCIEIASLSKSAGFTGLRCGWLVIPKENQYGLHALWSRLSSTFFNGVSYPVQRAAYAALSEEGLQDTRAKTEATLTKARLLREGLLAQGYTVTGGEHAPYVWVKVPGTMSGWQWFDYLLEQKQIVATPGEGFGVAGTGYLRFSAFAARGDIEEALLRMDRHP